MKKAFALLLILCLMAGLLTSCANTPSDTNAPSNTSEAENPGTAEPSGSDETPDDGSTPADDIRCGIANQPLTFTGEKLPDDQRSEYVWQWDQLDDINYVKLPLTETKEEISAFLIWSSDYLNDPNESLGIQEFEKRTNVHINWDTVATAAGDEQFNLMIASSDWSDIILNAEKYTGGTTAAVEDGVYLELTDLVNTCMPNFQACLELGDEYRRMTLNNDGKICAIGQYEYVVEPLYYSPCVHQHLLDRMGLDTPETLEDWENAILAGREQLGIRYGYWPALSSDRTSNPYTIFTAFDTYGDFYQVDGVVHYGPIEDGYRDALKFLHGWYEKGYLGDDWYAVSSDRNFKSQKLCDYEHLFWDGGSGNWGNMLVLWGGKNDDPDLNVTAIANPVLTKGQTRHFRQVVPPVREACAAITTSAKNPELCARWLDYRMSYEGKNLWWYGVEGKDYEVNDDGTITLSIVSAMANNWGHPDYQTYEELFQRDVFGGTGMIAVSGGGWYEWRSTQRIWDEKRTYDNRHSSDIMIQSSDADWMLPTYDIKTEYLVNGYASTLNDIQTHIDEMYVKFITGAVDIDAEWPSFVESLKRMGIQKCIDAQQDSLNAYLAR